MRKAEAAVLVFAIMGPIFVGIGLFIWWAIKQQVKRRGETLRRVAESFGTPTIVTDAKSAVARITSEAIETDLNGHHYRIFTFVRGRYEYCEIQLVTKANLPLVVFRPENGRDRLGRTLFLNREVQLDDQTFDDAVYIETDERDEHIKQTLAEPAMRDAVLGAIKAGHTVTLSQHGVSMVIPISFSTPAKEQIEKKIGLLEELAKGVRNVDGADGTWKGNRGDLLFAVLYIVMGIGYVAMMVTSTMDTARYEPLHKVGQKLPTQLSGIGFLAYVLLSFLYVRGHSRSLRNFFMGLLPAIFVFPMMPSIVLWSANALLDSAPTTIMRGQVTEHTQSKSGKSSSYRIRMAVDPEDTQPQPQYMHYSTLGLLVPYGTWKSLAVGDRVEVVVHKGGFEWPYIGPITKSASPAPTPAAPAPAPQ